MMRFKAGCNVLLLGPMLLLAACGSGGVNHTTRELGNRLQNRLAPDIAAGQAGFQPLSTGAQVTLLEPTMFANGGGALTDKGHDLLASVIQGLMDPKLMQINVADPTATTDSLQAQRVDNISQFFVAYGLGDSLQPAAVAPQLQSPPSTPTAAPISGVTITINVQCPPHDWSVGYDSGRPHPTCD